MSRSIGKLLDHAEVGDPPQVIDALHRLDTGTYGRPMRVLRWPDRSRRRLEAVPYAASCIECERKRERAFQRERREDRNCEPIEEPLGEMANGRIS